MSTTKPLEGIKVIEISTIITASLSAMMLSDQGAEVIKIEQTGFGDPLRYLGTQKGGISAIFANTNRGKRSVELDLKIESDLEQAKKLISEADVLINNFRPGVMDSLGLGKEDCKTLEEYCESIRKSVIDLSIPFQDNKINITISGGVIKSSEVKDQEEFVNIADERLYKAKEGGRNQFIYS